MSISRRTTAACCIAAGLLVLLGMLATPWEETATTAAYLQAIGDNAAQGEIAALLLHFGYLLMVPVVFGLLGALREWGGRFRAIGGVLAVVGWATLPGMLVVDFYAIALEQRLPIEQAVGVEDAAASMTGAAVIGMTGAIPAFLGLLLLTISARRAKLVGTWVPLATVAAIAAPIALSGVGLVGMTVAAVALLAALAGIARGVLQEPAPITELPDPELVREPVAA